MKALHFDVGAMELYGEVEVRSKQRIDDMYYSTDKGPLPIAYLFKPEHREQLERAITTIKRKRDELRRFEAEYYYKVFPNLRI